MEIAVELAVWLAVPEEGVVGDPVVELGLEVPGLPPPVLVGEVVGVPAQVLVAVRTPVCVRVFPTGVAVEVAEVVLTIPVEVVVIAVGPLFCAVVPAPPIGDEVVETTRVEVVVPVSTEVWTVVGMIAVMVAVKVLVEVTMSDLVPVST